MILKFEFTSFSLINPQVTSNEIQSLLLLAFLKIMLTKMCYQVEKYMESIMTKMGDQFMTWF